MIFFCCCFFMDYQLSQLTKKKNLQNGICAQRRLILAWALFVFTVAWRKLGSLSANWAHSKDSDQPGRLIWIFAGRTSILLVLSCADSVVIACESLTNLKVCEIFASVCTSMKSIKIHFYNCPTEALYERSWIGQTLFSLDNSPLF